MGLGMRKSWPPLGLNGYLTQNSVHMSFLSAVGPWRPPISFLKKQDTHLTAQL